MKLYSRNKKTVNQENEENMRHGHWLLQKKSKSRRMEKRRVKRIFAGAYS